MLYLYAITFVTKGVSYAHQVINNEKGLLSPCKDIHRIMCNVRKFLLSFVRVGDFAAVVFCKMSTL